MDCTRTVGLILAAGRSSRLGECKALLPMGKSNIICAAVQKLLKYCSEIVIVTGRDALQVKDSITEYPQVKAVYNSNYETTPMFSSVLMGIESVRDKGDRLFILPCDTPAFREHTLGILLKYMNVTAVRAVKPTFGGHSGHPILIDMGLSGEILGYDGGNGLAGALDAAGGVRVVAVPDAGILLDTDTPQDYERLLQYYQNREMPTYDECGAILDFMHVPDNIRAHCRAVEERAINIADELKAVGYPLDRKLIYTAALLHDICRQKEQHAQQGAQILREMGFCKVADIVSEHMDILRPEDLNECAIVYYADKTTVKDEYVTLDEREQRILKYLAGDNEAIAVALRRVAAARTIEREIYRHI